ncbi:hypothetical protein PS1_019282 [Malus domestica]
MDQEPHILVSLHEYFPNDLFQQCTTTTYHIVEVEIEEPSKGKAIAIEEEKTLTPKKRLPAYFSIKEELRLPKKMRKVLIAVLVSPDDPEVQESKDEGLKLRPHEYTTYCATHDTINFIDEDLVGIKASQSLSLRLWVCKGAQNESHAGGW